MQSSLALSIAVMVLITVLTALVFTTYGLSITSSQNTNSAERNRVPAGRWVIVGTGLTACTTIWNLAPPVRATFGLRECNNRLGGRVLTTPQPVLPVSTWTQAQEFGAWTVDPSAHSLTLDFLQQLEIQTTLQYAQPSASFVFTKGTKQPWPVLPSGLDATMAYGKLDAATANALFAHTGIAVTAAPDAAVGAIVPLAMSPVTAVPTGTGWISVGLRAIGLTPVQYQQRLHAIAPQADGTLRLTYDSGTQELVRGALFTGAPENVVDLQGVSDTFRSKVRDAFVPITMGVMYLTYTAQDTWWPALGFVDATVTTDTDLGQISTVETGTLRVTIVNADAVNAWTALLVAQGLTAAKTRVTTLLQTIFNQTSLPQPAFIAYRGWPQGMWLWRANQDTAAVSADLSRPMGPDVPFFWACSELDTAFPNRVEGCISIAKQSAADIQRVIVTQ